MENECLNTPESEYEIDERWLISFAEATIAAETIATETEKSLESHARRIRKDLLKLIAEALLEYETLTKEQIDYLVENGKMPEEKDDSYESMSITKLREIAKEKGIKNVSKMNKAELLKELDD